MEQLKETKQLKKIRDEVVACKKCGLCKTRILPVVGQGCHQADLVFVGEAPGSNEDRTGVPFCGRAGEVLNELLESAGIKTAFVDVNDPEKEIGHVYLLFDTGLPPEQSNLISSNEKRLIQRESITGKSTIWLPVETTLIEEGFEEAWSKGAMQYLQNANLRNGLLEGWVKIINVN